MTDSDVDRIRAANLWEPLARKFPPLAKAAWLAPSPGYDFDSIGGLAEAKEEMLTYACATTDPEVYERWGTIPPTALLLIGAPECGKSLLAEALATHTGTPFLGLRVPRLVLQVLHAPAVAGPLLAGWLETLAEMPRITVFMREIDFSHVHTLMGRRPDAAGNGPLWDFVLELVDRTIELEQTIVVASTSHADTISPLVLEPGRFERVVEVNPVIPKDIVEVLQMHTRAAEQRAGRQLFGELDWAAAVSRGREASIGQWLRILHAVLRRKARCDAAHEEPGLVTIQDVLKEVERFGSTAAHLPASTGSYL